MRASVEDNWLRGLATLLAVGYVAMGIDCGGIPAVLAIGGALVVVSTLFRPSIRPGARRLLLLVGALPFAVAAWWSVAAPLTGLVLLLFGMLTIRGDSRRRTAPA